MRRSGHRSLQAVWNVWLLGTTGAARAEDLWDVYRLAIGNAPQIQEADALRRARQQRLPEARGALLPQVGAYGSREETSQDGQRLGMTDGGIGLTNVNTDATTTSYGVELRQPVLYWDRWVRLRQARAEGAQADVDYRVSFDDLVLRAADLYFAQLAAEDLLAAARANRKAIEEQLEQSRNRFEVGLAAITDLQEARAAHDQSRAEEIEAMHAVRLAEDALRAVTGTPVGKLARPPPDIALPGLEMSDEQAWVDRALQSNAEIASARLSLEIADREVARRQAVRLPTVDLVASRNHTERDSNNVFDALDVNGDSIRLEFVLPVFTSGVITARTRQAGMLREAAASHLETVQLDVEQRARAAFLNVAASLARVEAFRQAVISAEAALDATRAGYESGTRTVLEVLNSQRNLLISQTALARATYVNLSSRLRLAMIAGALNEDLMRETNASLTLR